MCTCTHSRGGECVGARLTWHAFDLFQIDYPTFEKNFYIEHEEIAKLTDHDVQDLRRKLAMKVKL